MQIKTVKLAMTVPVIS